MRRVHLDQVEAGLHPAPGGVAEVGDDLVHVGAGHLAGQVAALAVGERRRAETSQLSAGSGSSMPSHISLVEPLRPEWPSWRPIFAVLRSWTKVDHPGPGVALLVGPQTGAAERDPALG